MAGAGRHGGGRLNTPARRVYGLLLVWASVGLLFGAAAAPWEQEVLQDLAERTDEIQPEDIPPPTPLGVGLMAGLAALALALGAWMLATSRGAAAEDAASAGPATGYGEGAHGPVPPFPVRCWRCRAPWPADREACPSCGAPRLR